ncbi:MAG: transposase [Candidatus Nitrosocosmicus sp.]|nr:transposase [Candidatus Nitrosocosmicus sp.]
MFTLSVLLPNESWCASLLRNVRWKKDNVVCPRCQSYNIKRTVNTVAITKSTFASSVADGSMIKQVPYFIIHIPL